MPSSYFIPQPSDSIYTIYYVMPITACLSMKESFPSVSAGRFSSPCPHQINGTIRYFTFFVYSLYPGSSCRASCLQSTCGKQKQQQVTGKKLHLMIFPAFKFSRKYLSRKYFSKKYLSRKSSWKRVFQEGFLQKYFFKFQERRQNMRYF